MLRAAATLARAARTAGLGDAFAATRDTADAVFLRGGVPPFSACVNGVRVRGYLRHRRRRAEEPRDQAQRRGS